MNQWWNFQLLFWWRRTSHTLWRIKGAWTPRLCMNNVKATDSQWRCALTGDFIKHFLGISRRMRDCEQRRFGLKRENCIILREIKLKGGRKAFDVLLINAFRMLQISTLLYLLLNNVLSTRRDE
jgi:hypothetical protein